MGSVYTPRLVVDEIFARVCKSGLSGKTVCDPACGDGNFLTVAAEKMCSESASLDTLREDLENGIFGFDYDSDALSKCRRRLDAVARSYGIDDAIEWNLKCIDSVDKSQIQPYFGMFDYVVGNPPYIRIQNLSPEMRLRLSQYWRVAARGCTDIYMAFYEIGLELLKENGALGFITPNGWTKTDSGEPLRRLLARGKNVDTLIDFGEHQLFKDATTYALIAILRKTSDFKPIKLWKYNHNNEFVFHGAIPKDRLSAARWDLCDSGEYSRLDCIRKRGKPLGKIADIHVGVQTLADDVFILEKYGEDETLHHCLNSDGAPVKIEKEVALPILKVSVMKDGKDTKERILVCPYRRESLHEPILIPEDEMRERFPNAFGHLSAHKLRLLSRDRGVLRYPWHAHGREMDLQKTLGDKILTAGMNRAPNFMRCVNPQYTFYSGYAVKIRDNAISAEDLLAQLNSDDMHFFINQTGRDYRNGWKSYSKAFIKDFGVLNARLQQEQFKLA